MQESPSQSSKLLTGERGLPSNYPSPLHKNLLFYIQHNRDCNTVIYDINIKEDGQIDEENPIKVYWKMYSNGKIISQLNKFQENLAYGYQFTQKRINCYEFNLVSYDKVKFYLRKYQGQFRIVTKVNNIWSIVEHIYVFVENLGLFQKVKFAEIYGFDLRYNIPVYQKINN